MIRSFQTCLELWVQKSFRFSANHSGPWINSEIVNQYFSETEEKLLPKKFKYLLCSNFSKLLNQDRPEGPKEWDISIKKFIHKRSRTSVLSRLSKPSTPQRIAMWNLLQCKTLAADVNHEFIQEALQKHRETMQKQPNLLDVETEKSFREFIQPWIKTIIKNYTGKTDLPTNHSCVSHTRSMGGTREALKTNLVPSMGRRLTYQPRVEPVVITLEGPPGSGKSTLVKILISKLCKSFNLPKVGVYYRSSAVKHWDGYHGQPIVVLDDMGAFASSNTQISEDMTELLQLVSECDYILPMADLKDKGTKFTSSIIIITTNMATLHGDANRGFACSAAVMRRFGTVYRVVKGKTFETQIGDSVQSMTTGDRDFDHELNHFWRYRGDYISTDSIITKLRAQYDHFHRIIRQPIEGFSASINFQQEDLADQPNIVKVSAIVEPLKVRTITRPDCRTYALKPLQLAMFKSLRQWKCFEPCWDPEYNLQELLKPKFGELLLSGDYTSATDDLNPQIVRIVGEELVKEFGPGFLSDLITWESGEHIVCYPPKTNLDAVRQTNGQLMGSLLSFPILCLANAFTMCRATGSPLAEVRAVFHGDDIAAVVSQDQYKNWIKEAESIGLSLSVGKNYLSTDFVSIDSQLFTWDNGQLRRQITGKFKLISRYSNELNCRSALRMGFTKSQIRRYCNIMLKSSLRSLDVSYEEGGLGLETTRPLTIVDRAIYHVISNKKKRACLINGSIRVPVELARILKLDVRKVQSPPEDAISESNLNKKVWQTIRAASKNYKFYCELMTDKLRPLSSFRSCMVHCDYTPSELDQMYRRFFMKH
jgi:hypothetical protein